MTEIDRIVESLRDKPAPEGYPTCAACENCSWKNCTYKECTPWRQWFREAWQTVTEKIKGTSESED